MKVLIAPTAFKGCLTPMQAARAIGRGVQQSGWRAKPVYLPLADGGDGTLEAFLAGGGARHTVETVDALGRPLRAAFGLLPDQTTAVIEMAQASGVARLPRHMVGPASALDASTYGTGVLVRAALDAGARRVVLGLGGSATTDGGAGCLQALGARLYDGHGRELRAGGGALAGLARLDLSGLDPRLQTIELVLATDVRNPALGERGAARVFGPQKGAGAPEIERLEAGLAQWLAVCAAQTGRDTREVEGGGAAGAFAAGMMSAVGGQIVSGAQAVLTYHEFERVMRGVGLVVTGEGMLDAQSLQGKAPMVLAQRARALGVPTVAIVGGVRGSEREVLRASGLAAVLPVVTRPMPLHVALREAEGLVEAAGYRLGCFMALSGQSFKLRRR